MKRAKAESVRQTQSRLDDKGISRIVLSHFPLFVAFGALKLLHPMGM